MAAAEHNPYAPSSVEVLNRSGAEPYLRACFSGSLTDLTDRPEGWLRTGLRLLLVSTVVKHGVDLLLNFFAVAVFVRIVPVLYSGPLQAIFWLRWGASVLVVLSAVLIIAGTAAFRRLACCWLVLLLLSMVSPSLLLNAGDPWPLWAMLWDTTFSTIAAVAGLVVLAAIAQQNATVWWAKLAIIGRLVMCFLSVFGILNSVMFQNRFGSQQTINSLVVQVPFILLTACVSLLEIRVVFEVLRSHVQPITPLEQPVGG